MSPSLMTSSRNATFSLRKMGRTPASNMSSGTARKSDATITWLSTRMLATTADGVDPGQAAGRELEAVIDAVVVVLGIRLRLGIPRDFGAEEHLPVLHGGHLVPAGARGRSRSWCSPSARRETVDVLGGMRHVLDPDHDHLEPGAPTPGS